MKTMNEALIKVLSDNFDCMMHKDFYPAAKAFDGHQFIYTSDTHVYRHVTTGSPTHGAVGGALHRC